MDRTDTLLRMVDALYDIAEWDGFPTGVSYHDPIRGCWWFPQVVNGRVLHYSMAQSYWAVDAKTTMTGVVHRIRATEWSAWVVTDTDACRYYGLDTHDLDGNVEQFERDAVLLILAKPP